MWSGQLRIHFFIQSTEDVLGFKSNYFRHLLSQNIEAALTGTMGLEQFCLLPAGVSGE